MITLSFLLHNTYLPWIKLNDHRAMGPLQNWFIELPFGFHPCVYIEGLTGVFSEKFFIKLSKSLLSMFTKVLFSLHKNSGRNFSHVSALGKLSFGGIPSMLLFYGHHIYFVIFVLTEKKIQILIHGICES